MRTQQSLSAKCYDFGISPFLPSLHSMADLRPLTSCSIPRAQSFLLGVSKIIIGFRDSRGILRSLEEYPTSALPSRAKKSGKNLWNGNTCINFTAAFLKWLQAVIVDEGVVWKICHHEGATTIQVYPVPTQQSFLCSEFVAWREKQDVNSVSDVNIDSSTGKVPSIDGRI